MCSLQIFHNSKLLTFCIHRCLLQPDFSMFFLQPAEEYYFIFLFYLCVCVWICLYCFPVSNSLFVLFFQVCYICEEQSRESKAATGACMQCNKNGCKQNFHVTWLVISCLLCCFTRITTIKWTIKKTKCIAIYV